MNYGNHLQIYIIDSYFFFFFFKQRYFMFRIQFVNLESNLVKNSYFSLSSDDLRTQQIYIWQNTSLELHPNWTPFVINGKPFFFYWQWLCNSLLSSRTHFVPFKVFLEISHAWLIDIWTIKRKVTTFVHLLAARYKFKLDF